jgi:prepilin-type N-terminal cleavage/methylation domain-containing protein
MHRFRHAGFTLVELLVVIAIIGVLIALLLPAIQKVRESSQRTQCQSQMRQLAIALHTSQDAYSTMPRWGQPDYPWPSSVAAPTPQWSGAGLHFYLLPFIDQATMMQLWVNAHAERAGYLYSTAGGNPNGPIAVPPYFNISDYIRQPPPKIYICPSDPSGPIINGLVKGSDYGDGTAPNNPGIPITNYPVNYQVFSVGTPRVPGTFADGASTTGMLYERYGRTTSFGQRVCNPWDIQTADRNRAIVYIDGTATAACANACAGDNSSPACNTAFSPTNPWALFQLVPPMNQACSTTAQAPHPSGINVAMGDASVRVVTSTVSVTTWSAAVTPNNKDVVGPDL